MKGPEERTIDVDVEALDTRGRTVVGYAAVYGVPSEPLAQLDGAREQIAPGAFEGVLGSDVRALLNHDPNEVLGRTKSGTLRLSDEQRGLRFELDLPDSPLGENVRSAVKRGDIDGAIVQVHRRRRGWDGDVRTITKVKELHDVTVATYPAYASASIELRTRNKGRNRVEEQTTSSDGEEPSRTTSTQEERANIEHRPESTERDQGGSEARTLLEKYIAAGFTPGGGRTEFGVERLGDRAPSRGR